MNDKIIINDPELGEIDITNEEETAKTVNEIEEAMKAVTAKVSSGVGMENLRDFRMAIERGDKKAAQKAIDETEDADVKASMERLMQYL